MEMKVTKSNAIINSSYRLSLNELRIVLYGLSKINPLDDDFPLFHRIDMEELEVFYGIDAAGSRSFRRDIRAALLSRFWERAFSYYDEDIQETVRRRWLIEVRYGRNDGSLAYHYNPLIKKELQTLSKRFTSYFLSNVANMRSAYSIRIYEIAIMHLNASGVGSSYFKSTVSDLKDRLDIAHKYKNFGDLNRRVLATAEGEISKFSDIVLSYKQLRRGCSVHEIEFCVSRKKSVHRDNKQKLPHLPDQVTSKDHIEKVSLRALEKAKVLVMAARTGWDIYAIEQQFYDFITKKGAPSSVDGAFIGFVKKKVAKAP